MIPRQQQRTPPAALGPSNGPGAFFMPRSPRQKHRPPSSRMRRRADARPRVLSEASAIFYRGAALTSPEPLPEPSHQPEPVQYPRSSQSQPPQPSAGPRSLDPVPHGEKQGQEDLRGFRRLPEAFQGGKRRFIQILCYINRRAASQHHHHQGQGQERHRGHRQQPGTAAGDPLPL